jgi:predicted ABC-type ATPase
MKRIIIIAGPNGAGKTTFAREYLLREGACRNFINADLIAAGLSPFNPAGAAIQAGRLMLLEMRRYLSRGEDFAFETTLSGRSYVQQIANWQSRGYRVELTFLKLSSIRMALSRVKGRVTQGGHHVPASVVVAGSRPAGGTSNRSIAHWSITGNCTTIPEIDRC